VKHLVLGGGPAGLFAAWHLRARGEEVEVWEANSEIGGWAQTLSWQECHTLEKGPQSLSWKRGSALDRLLRDLDLPFQPSVSKPRWILKQGTLHLLPWGLGWLRSDLLSRSARLRLLLEPVQGTSPFEESLEDFVARRLGHRFARDILPALCASLLAAPPGEVDAAVLPILGRLEAKGGLAREAIRSAFGRTREQRIVPLGGIGALMEALASPLRIRRNQRALNIEPEEKRWRVVGESLGKGISDAIETRADQIWLALPAFEAAPLLRKTSPEAAELLARIPYRSLGTWHSRHVVTPELAQGFSLLLDPAQAQGCLGCTARPAGPGQIQLRSHFQPGAVPTVRGLEILLQGWLPGLGTIQEAVLINAERAIPSPLPGQMAQLNAAMEELPKSLRWIGVPRFGAGLVETFEGIRRVFA